MTIVIAEVVQYTRDPSVVVQRKCHPKLGRHLGILGKVAFTASWSLDRFRRLWQDMCTFE